MIDNYVTGANGFIGKHLMSKLTGETVAVPHSDIFKLRPLLFRKFFFLSTYGNMIHHGSRKHILASNVVHLAFLLDALLDDSAFESFVFVSSSSVNLPVQTPYSRAKRAAEEMILASGIPACIVRPYSVTGVGEQLEHLIPTLIRSCFKGEPMKLVLSKLGLGPTHDFVDVEDVVNGLIALADNRATGVFEFGSGTSWTNGDVLNLVEEICERKANVKIVESLREYDNPNWRCDNYEARKFGWAPKKTLAHSIQEMVEAYKRDHA